MQSALWTLSDEVRDARVLAQMWDQVFQGALGALPAVVHSPCCAEFVVSRARILQRSREFYASLRCGLQVPL